jgi:hypothetical protein
MHYLICPHIQIKYSKKIDEKNIHHIFICSLEKRTEKFILAVGSVGNSFSRMRLC